MLNLTPEESPKLSEGNSQVTSQLITPPLSVKPAASSNYSVTEKSNKADIVNKYITEASIFITSFWKNPIKDSTVFSLFENRDISHRDYEHFAKEVLKRSRCSLLGLQIAMYYLFKLRKQIKNRFVSNSIVLMCPKRTFLVCLILSFKFNYDSNYSFKSWSKISGLPVSEIKTLEFQILKALDYDLNYNAAILEKWNTLLNQALEKCSKLIEMKTKNSNAAGTTSLFSKKRSFGETTIKSENSYKKLRVEIA